MAKAQTRDNVTFQRFYEYIVEVGLEEDIRNICRRHAVTLRDVYLDVRGPSVHAARLEIWWWLSHRFGKSPKEVGRIFDRDPTSILYAMRKLHERSAALGLDINKHDAETVARAVSLESQGNRSRAGLEHVNRINESRRVTAEESLVELRKVNAARRAQPTAEDAPGTRSDPPSGD